MTNGEKLNLHAYLFFILSTEQKPVRLSLHLICKRHLPPDSLTNNQEKMYVDIKIIVNIFKQATTMVRS